MRAVNCLEYRNEDDYQHNDDVDAQPPKHRALGERKALAAEMRSALGSDDLIGLEKREHDARIFQIRWTLGGNFAALKSI